MWAGWVGGQVEGGGRRYNLKSNDIYLAALAEENKRSRCLRSTDDQKAWTTFSWLKSDSVHREQLAERARTAETGLESGAFPLVTRSDTCEHTIRMVGILEAKLMSSHESLTAHDPGISPQDPPLGPARPPASSRLSPLPGCSLLLHPPIPAHPDPIQTDLATSV